jgi:hypothetical protein
MRFDVFMLHNLDLNQEPTFREHTSLLSPRLPNWLCIVANVGTPAQSVLE